jgi:hypothetical protein
VSNSGKLATLAPLVEAFASGALSANVAEYLSLIYDSSAASALNSTANSNWQVFIGLVDASYTSTGELLFAQP